MSKLTSADQPARGSAATVLVTGATGNIGTALTKLLAARGVPFRALVRTPDEPPARALAALPGAEVVVGDFDAAASVTAALAGIERAFLLTNSSAQAETQQLAFVGLARQAGVRHLVKQSQWAAAALRCARRGLGLAAWQAEGLLEDYAYYHRSEAATIAAGGRAATGQAPRDFAAFAHDYAPAFR